MKNFFSFKNNNFNIFTATGLVLIFLSFFYIGQPLIFFALIIGWIPDMYMAINNYKKSKKITSIMILYILTFIILVVSLIIELFTN
ncbi:hypothetical protein [Romboutsia lituseburensis]|uniref:hypothetical protein n=1 Tax=Romboutsia lituseburensis TaxID=1537 RepID=UPI00215AD50B|nr:hypothetical protein [Romboutsia lituseburensis]MCR8744214.1 hypothetical protein [Romboutsia lituseburensis]